MPALFGVGSLIFCVLIVPQAERRVAVTPLSLSLRSSSPSTFQSSASWPRTCFMLQYLKQIPDTTSFHLQIIFRILELVLYAFPGAAVTEPTDWPEKGTEVCHLTVGAESPKPGCLQDHAASET